MKEYKPDALSEALIKALKMDGEVARTLRNIEDVGVLVSDFKAFTYQGACWLQDKGIIVIDSDDGNKISYYMLSDLSFETTQHYINYWADRESRLKLLEHQLRRLRCKAAMCGFDINSVECPGVDAEIYEWEGYINVLAIKIGTAEVKEAIDQLEEVTKESQHVQKPKAPKKASAAAVVITLLLMFLFAIFLTWACFIR